MNKKVFFPFTFVVLLILSSFTLKDSPDWQLTDKYSVWFTSKRVSGFFHKVKGEISFDENKLSSAHVKLEMEVKSIATGFFLKTWNAKRPKWFDAKQFPTITFTSEKFQKAAKGYIVNGKLKVKGVEKNITVPFSFLDKTFFGSFKIKRTDFNMLKMKGLAKMMVSDTITVNFTLPVTK